jgi:CubicO group peptidase (beta-lactamase class C family)
VHAWGLFTERADIASAFKPVLAHLVYAAVEEGLIGGLDSPVGEHYRDLKDTNESLGYKDRRITWRHLLTQTSGYGVSEEPGAAFNYSDYSTALLADALVHHVYDSSYDRVDGEILSPLLADPIRWEDEPTLAGDRRSHPGRLRISVRDLARFGLLYLGEGTFGGKKVIDQETIQMAVSSPLPATMPRTAQEEAETIPSQRTIGGGVNMEDHLGAYSYMWWLNLEGPDGKRLFPNAPPDTYASLGHGGRHVLLVIPSLDIVASWAVALEHTRPRKVSGDGRGAVNEALGLLLAAVSDSSS